MLLSLAAAAFAADRAVPAPTAVPLDHPGHARIEAALDRVDATPAQREAVRSRLDQSHDLLVGYHAEAHDLRERFHDALFGQTVDRDGLEDVRAEAVDLFDRASSDVVEVAADVAELFSAGQRQELHALVDERLADRFARWKALRD
jgi:Spy/CpxP family protein refolding chaperone